MKSKLCNWPDGVHEVWLSGSIWSDDRRERQERSETSETFVRLEVLELDVLQLSGRSHGRRRLDRALDRDQQKFRLTEK